MKYFFKLAFANIVKARLRTILTFMIITFAIAMFVFFEGLLAGFINLSVDNLIGFETGHFKIRSENYDENSPFVISNFIAGYEELYPVLEEKPYIKGFTERIYFLAEIDNAIDALAVMAVGINPETDYSVFTLSNFIEEGELIEGGALIGKNLADDMNLQIGDWVYLTFRDADGMFNSVETTINGIVNSADPYVNSSTVFITIDEAKTVLNTDSVSEIAIRTDNPHRVKRYGVDLQKSLPDHVNLFDWHYLGADVIAFMETDAMSAYVMVFFIVIIGMVGIVNTMLMSVYEKKREIGMLKALGMTDGEVRGLFVLEGAIIGMFGGLFGIILGSLVNWYFVVNGMDIQAMMGGQTLDIGYRVMGVVKSEWNFPSMIGAFLFCIIASALASLYPASKTVKMQPMECLRVNQ
jgi:putative ABC transport system permease protein